MRETTRQRKGKVNASTGKSRLTCNLSCSFFSFSAVHVAVALARAAAST